MSPKPPKALRGRPGAAPAEALREHLIDAAQRLMEGRPPLLLTTRDIARAAGVSDGVLYNHFADKDDLIIAALLRRYDKLNAAFEAALPEAGSGTLAGNLEALARAALALHAEALPLLAGLVTAPALLHRLFDRIHGKPAAMPMGPRRVAEYFAAERTLGRIAAAADPVAATRLLFGGMLSLALAGHLLAGGRTPPPDDIAAVVDTLIRGLRPDAARRRARPGQRPPTGGRKK